MECRDRGMVGNLRDVGNFTRQSKKGGKGVMGTRWIAVVAAVGLALSASAVLAQCGCGSVAVAPTYAAPAVTYYSPAPYATYYTPAVPYATYYSPYVSYYSPYVSYYGGYYGGPVWGGVYARPRFAYRPVVIW